MSTKMMLPELGENVENGDIVQVMVSPGDTIAKDQPVLEIEAGKASMEVPSTVEGEIEEVHIKEGQTVSVGDVVLSVKSETGAETEAESELESESESESELEAEAELEAESGSGEASAEEEQEPEPPPKREAPEGPAKQEKRAAGKAVAASPKVRRLARELGVDIHEVPASKPDERISEEDVKNFARSLLEDRERGGGPSPARPSLHHAMPLPDFSRWGEVRRERMSQTRKATMEHLTSAWFAIPHVTQHDRAEITRLEELREKFQPNVEKEGGKLTLTAILIKMLAGALKVFPRLNCSIDPANEEIIYKDYVHIGVAVDTDRGLLVPVLRDADRKNIKQIAVETGELARKAREGKMSREDLEGGTFTLTNIGGIGGSFFTPIINAPEVAILGVGRATLEPCMGRDENLCRPRLRLPLSLSYDHRIIDGADGARFLKWVVDALEEPMLLSLEG
ncbi:2-oxo acid dehydrogenase subunit E2 [Kiritimatiella glycovorans]|uniref:Dihydrolipoamide acetyltransferase component of pyruvate dehydrogenase complex n=1 Tax=Kiritimatiella glycovorans TaxID=1307763 RepID=A0A0G3EG51_9BACT|nr:2-oxo acid dehydrogenase subunit E2 [Kiritimatiella glycovorans]AKJ65431.1 Dihydrolipoyllysine-residue acetyltransferase component of pyruvate dehydrogenase complex [Kiritimatiella glycovorans]